MKSVVALLMLLLFAAVSSPAAQAPAKSKVETGSIGDAAYRIEIPPNWNKSLVLVVHGYTQPTPAMLEGAGVQQSQDVFLSRGFAVASSLFSLKAYTVKSPQGFAEGYAAKEGLEDTEMLRRHFVATYGRPERTYVVGQSMGAIVTVALLERYPDEYDGALPMCGPLVSATEFFNLALLDLMVTFDYLFPNVLGSPFAVNGDITAKVRAALEAAPDKASSFANRVQRPVASLPAVIAFYQRIAAELVQRAGGNPFDNTNRVYKGFGDDAAVNQGVKRYRADAKARAYLRQYYSPTGRIQDPVLTLMSLGDQLVPPNWATDYEFQTVREGTQNMFVVRFVDGQGHCSYNARQMADAFDALVAWDRDGKRPQ